MKSSRIISSHEALNTGKKVDYVVPFPYCSNIEVDPAGQLRPRLSVMSNMAILAAFKTWEQHPGAKIIIPGETPFNPEEYPNTSDLMVERANELSGGTIPDGVLIPLHKLNDGKRGHDNTYLQSEGLSEHPELNTDSTIYEALDYHADRVEAALNAHGVEGDIVVIEDVLHEIGIHDYDRFAPVIDGLRRSERIVRALTWLPGTQKGLIPNLIMKRSGPRVVDVIENDDGTLGLENVTSRKKAARLEKQIVAARQTKTT
jgi:hypothetical protein